MTASPGLPRITGLVRREETLVRFPGAGDGLTTTWAADDRQLVALEDGYGWGHNWRELAPEHGAWNSRLFTLSGSPDEAQFEEIKSYPPFQGNPDGSLYYGFGTIAVDGRIHQFLSTLNRQDDPSGWRWVGAKLITSPDGGRTWCNQDGSSPVRWETWEERSRSTLAFWEEPQDAFSLLSFLQMGRDYALNRDGYLYVYGPNGNTDATMTELMLFRVAKDRILDRSAYEYFAGRDDDGARWTRDMDRRAPVHVFPRGWVNEPGPGLMFNVESWVPSVVYNEPLGVYLMVSFGCGPEGKVFGKPSYLGFWMSATPWGPWTQIHEEKEWCPGGDVCARAFNSQIPPKWIAADGKSFQLVWADFQTWGIPKAAQDATNDENLDPAVRERIQRDIQFRRSPNYTFNMQQVDLIMD